MTGWFGAFGRTKMIDYCKVRGCTTRLPKKGNRKYGLLCRYHFLQERKRYRFKQKEEEENKYTTIHTIWGPFLVANKSLREKA